MQDSLFVSVTVLTSTIASGVGFVFGGDSMIRDVYIYTSGATMVFSERGQQMPRYQESWNTAKEKILKASSEATRFYFANWGGSAVSITREQAARISVGVV